MAKVLGFNARSVLRLVSLLVLGWFFVLFCFVKPLLNSTEAPSNSQLDLTGNADHRKTYERLNQALNELSEIKSKNDELKEWVKKITRGEAAGNLPRFEGIQKNDKDSYLRSDKQPPASYEGNLRALSKDVEEMGYFVVGQLQKQSKSSPGLEKLLDQAKEHQRILTHDLKAFKAQDGYEAWREEEARRLRDLVFRRIQFNQNPKDCKTARKLLCNLNKSCGYGCQVHHVTYCLIVAYATQRTMILNSRNWRYSKSGWEKVFLPVSETCKDPSGTTKRGWPASEDVQVIELPIIDMISNRPEFLPPAVPKDLAKRISAIHGDPAAWWVSQFLGYLVRYQPDTLQMLNETAKAFGFEKPIVGVHVRRTDKVGTEAAFHGVEEYMQHVQDYYDLLEVQRPVKKRRVYLASDDPNVLPEAIRKYPDYEFIGDPEIAKGAAVATRYSDNSLRGVLTDIHFLAHSNYLVCTFSSQVCRVAYEMMNVMETDASSSFRSLDDIYYFGGGGGHKLRARFSHKAKGPDEVSFNAGDSLGIAGNHWDGFSKGQNYKTAKIGLFPSFKAEEFVSEVDFPTYPEVPNEV